MWSSKLHEADKVGYLSSGVVDASHSKLNGMLRVSVLYSTGSQDTIVEPVGYEQIRHPSLSLSIAVA